jgi:argininosuccinate synthase
MWSNTAEGGEIENPELTAPLDLILRWCKTPQKAPDAVDTVTLEFEKGVPVSMDGKKMELWDLIMKLNERAGKNGCGFHQLVEDRIVGLKVRGVYENPAASVLIAAHKKLEYLVSTREENEFKAGIDNKWAYLCYGAKYFEPTMDHIRAYLTSSNAKVTGWAKVTMYKGSIFVAATGSPYSLFNMNMATFDADLGAFNQNASPGFIELYNLAQKTSHAVRKAAKSAEDASPRKRARN